MGIEHRMKDEFQWEEPNTVMAKVSTFIANNTKGNDYPKEIWLNKKIICSFMQNYSKFNE